MQTVLSIRKLACVLPLDEFSVHVPAAPYPQVVKLRRFDPRRDDRSLAHQLSDGVWLVATVRPATARAASHGGFSRTASGA